LLAGFVLGVAVALSFSAQGLAADPADLEANLKITLVGVEKTLSLEEAKQALNVPSVSLALIDQDSIAFARAYGENATPDTLYQAASLSKFVAAVGAMRLVDQKKLALDDDVNAKLTSWKVPANGFDKSHPVTLRGLISMTAGIGVPGFLGYAVGVPLPNLTQILYGVPPANSPPVTLIAEPGSAYHYSGGSYEVAEALMVDVAQAPFPGLMDALVLKPAGMSRSTFMQPLPRTPEWQAVTGHSADGKEILGGWHVFPEHAAAGLWSTPTDLANLLLLLGAPGAAIAVSLARDGAGDADPAERRALRPRRRDRFLQRVADPDETRAEYRLSGLSDPVARRRSGHGGDDQSDNGSMLAEALIRRAADVYGWPELGRLQD
jgi:CubicO group peptidase (beta-lactamase class C family)